MDGGDKGYDRYPAGYYRQQSDVFHDGHQFRRFGVTLSSTNLDDLKAAAALVEEKCLGYPRCAERVL